MITWAGREAESDVKEVLLTVDQCAGSTDPVEALRARRGCSVATVTPAFHRAWQLGYLGLHGNGYANAYVTVAGRYYLAGLQ